MKWKSLTAVHCGKRAGFHLHRTRIPMQLLKRQQMFLSTPTGECKSHPMVLFTFIYSLSQEWNSPFPDMFTSTTKRTYISNLKWPQVKSFETLHPGDDVRVKLCTCSNVVWSCSNGPLVWLLARRAATNQFPSIAGGDWSSHSVSLSASKLIDGFTIKDKKT